MAWQFFMHLKQQIFMNQIEQIIRKNRLFCSKGNLMYPASNKTSMEYYAQLQTYPKEYYSKLYIYINISGLTFICKETIFMAINSGYGL